MCSTKDIFDKFIQGTVPAQIIFEDEKCIVMLANEQRTKGHTLVIPKQHVVDLLETDEELSAHLFKIATRVAKHLVNQLNANGVNILNNNCKAAGQTVFHFHIHVIPRYDANDGFKIEVQDNEMTYEQLEELKNLLIM